MIVGCEVTELKFGCKRSNKDGSAVSVFAYREPLSV